MKKEYKVRILEDGNHIPKGTILDVRFCNCGECVLPNDKEFRGMCFFKLSSSDRKKYNRVELSYLEVDIITTPKKDHLPTWL